MGNHLLAQVNEKWSDFVETCLSFYAIASIINTSELEYDLGSICLVFKKDGTITQRRSNLFNKDQGAELHEIANMPRRFWIEWAEYLKFISDQRLLNWKLFLSHCCQWYPKILLYSEKGDIVQEYIESYSITLYLPGMCKAYFDIEGQFTCNQMETAFIRTETWVLWGEFVEAFAEDKRTLADMLKLEERLKGWCVLAMASL